MKIPRYIVVDEIPLPLEVAEGFRYVNIDRNADDCYFPLAELFQELYFDEPARARLLRRERVVHRQAHRVHDLDPYPQAEDTWTRMSGRHREPDSYFVHGNYSGTAQMLVPDGTLLAIARELWRLTDELRAGRLEPTVDESTPLPPLPTPPPPRVYPPESPEDDPDDDESPAVVAPRFVVVDEVTIPLEVAVGFMYVTVDRSVDRAYVALADFFQELTFDEGARARLVAGERIVNKQAHRLHDLDANVEGEETWTRISGRHRDDDSYIVHSRYSGPTRVVLPYRTLLAIGKELWRLTDELRAGRLEPKVDLSTPLPPLPPAPPPRVYPPEPPDDDIEDEGAPVVAATAPPRVIAPPSSTDVLAGDVVLRDLERLATEVDQLAPLNQPVSLEAQATAAAKRRTLLLGLDVAGLLSASLLDAALAALERLGLPTLSGYHRAARAMFQYLGSEARARFNPGPPPVNLLDADVSLDWFRLPPAPMPEDVTAEEWLGLVESHFVRFRRPGDGDGTSFARLEDGLWCLRWRPEVGPLARLWRATPG